MTACERAVSDTHQTPVLELVDVVKTYRGVPPVHALAGVSLHVTDGELVAVVGPSGSGKSTLLNVIGTLDRPSSGRMLVEGQDVTSMSDASLAGLRAARLGFDERDIIACVLGLKPGDFYKSMEATALPGLWQDVYRPSFMGAALYVKLQISRVDDAVVISFKEL